LKKYPLSRYHALRGNVFFDALRHGGTTDYIAAKKFFFVFIALHGIKGHKASEETCPRKAWARELFVVLKEPHPFDFIIKLKYIT